MSDVDEYVEKFKNYTQLEMKIDFAEKRPSVMSFMACHKCGAIVADVELHTKWHGYGKVTFTNSTDKEQLNEGGRTSGPSEESSSSTS